MLLKKIDTLETFLQTYRKHFSQTFWKFFAKNTKTVSLEVKKIWNSKKSWKNWVSTNDPLNLLNAALRAVVKLYNQKFDNFLLKSQLKAERVPVKSLKRFLWTRRRQFWKPHEKTIDKSPTKKTAVIFTKVKGSLLTFSADTMNAALTNSTEVFFSESPKCHRWKTEAN